MDKDRGIGMIRRLTSGLPGAVYDVRLKLNVLVVGLCAPTPTVSFLWLIQSLVGHAIFSDIMVAPSNTETTQESFGT